MDAETQSQIDDLIELREAHKRRRKHLELQLALMGLSAGATIEIELESANKSILAIEETIGRLHKFEVRRLASILPNSLDPNIESVELHDRISAMAGYIVNVESAIHKEVGAMLRLFDTHNMQDEKQRRSRQRKVDIVYIVVVVLLFSILIVLLLK